MTPPHIHADGMLAALVRAQDWSRTPLGAREQWPSLLVSTVNLLLMAPVPMQLYWGPELVTIYNDSLLPTLGEKHPWALGRRGEEVWPEAWVVIGPQIEEARRTGRAVRFERVAIPLMQQGRLQETFWDYSYTPVCAEDGTVVGVLNLAQDVTVAVLAERRLQVSESRANRVLESIGDAVIVTDAELRVSRMNPVAQRLTGWEEAAARGRELREIFNLVDFVTRKRMEDPAHRVQRLDRSVELSSKALLLSRGGEEIYIDDSASPIRADDGSPAGMVLVFRDVTEKRTGELRERAASERGRFLLALVDQQNRIANPRELLQSTAEALARQLQADRVGYSEASEDQQTVGFVTGWAQGPLAVLSGEVAMARFGQSLTEALQRGETVVYPDVQLAPELEGSEGYREIGARAVVAVPIMRNGVWKGALYVNHSEPRAWTADEVLLAEEVTERMGGALERARAEEALRLTQERLQIAQAMAHIDTWEWDVETGEFFWTSERPWAYDRPSCELDRVEKIAEFVHPEDFGPVMAAAMTQLEVAGQYSAEFRLRWPDGSDHWTHGFCRVVRVKEGRPVRAVGVNMDVTERKLAELALIQSEKLAAVGRMASSIAHEINNPLEAVTNLLYLAQGSDDLREVRQHLEMADGELRRVSGIASQTLRFHRQSTKPTLATADDLVSSALMIQNSRIGNGGITVERLWRTERAVLCFDAEIRQVMSNLIGNAIDAMQGSKGGRRRLLLLRSREAQEWRTGRRGLSLTVADTGSGISAALLNRIFEAFFTTKGIGGTGLGLWISRDIVLRHGGTLRVRSSQREGRSGTVFVLFLPFEAAVR